MDAKTLQGILTENYGIEAFSLGFLREGGSHTYVVNGKKKYLLKVISRMKEYGELGDRLWKKVKNHAVQ